MSRSPVFQVMFSLQNTPPIPVLKLGGATLSIEDYERTTAKFDLSFYIIETANGLQGIVEYRTDLYEKESIARMISHYVNLLNDIAISPGKQAGQLKLISTVEEYQLLKDFNDTEAYYPKDKNIVSLFEDQARTSPDAIAVQFESNALTYKELNERSNQLAHHLQNKGVKAETLVPICLERSLEMIIGIIGILKAGGAYVPIDPEYPAERINYMLEDTAATLVVSSKASRNKLSGNLSVTIIALDEGEKLIQQEKSTNPTTVIKPDNLAYVIYTSGSTGKPKGVMVEHDALNNRLNWAKNYFNITEKDNILQKTTFCFDVSVWELILPLITGASLVFAIPGGQADNEYLKAIIDSQKITMMHFVPSMLSAFMADIVTGDCKGLKNVVCSGEALNTSQAELFREKLPYVTLHNLYGPTEAAIDVSYWTLNNEQAAIEVVPIGKPVDNTKLHILDKQGKLVPIGVPGELYIGGIQVARGYLNRPELTMERFINDPFSKQTGARLYKTGDLAKWLLDGNIEYLGRMDDQVKIRGYRIELGEIESVLEMSGLVKQAVVTARTDNNGTKRLIGYAVPDVEFDKTSIIAYLHSKIPEYMVPALWVTLDNIPLTSNGKTNKKALPEPELTVITAGYVEPRTRTELALAEVWQELLSVEKVGIYDNFFELGGDSILIIQMVSRMRRLGYIMQPKDVFNYKDIAALADLIDRDTENAVTGEQGILSGSFGLTPIQSWYLESEPADISHFNQSVLLQIDKIISAEILQSAFEQLVSQHDVLRLKFKKIIGVWQQEYGTARLQLATDDISDLQNSEGLAGAIKEKANRYQKNLAIEQGRMLGVVLIKTPAQEQFNRLLIIVHHLAVDGVSWRILLEDLEQLLNGYMNGRQPLLGSKSSSYRQWQSALVNYSKSRGLLGQKSYWEHTSGSYISLPEDIAYKDKLLVKDMCDHKVTLGTEFTRYLLQDIPKVYHTEMNDILLSALCATLCEWAGTSNVVVGLEGHGREYISAEIDSSRTMGWFTSLYPVLLRQGVDMGTLIKGVKEDLRRIPDKGLGYGVLKYIDRAAKLQGRDPWDIIFNYLGQLDTIVGSSDWIKAAEESGGLMISKEQLSSARLLVNSHISGGELVLRWSYSTKHYNKNTISKLADDYIKQLMRLINHCQEQGKSGVVYTPADYGLGDEVTYEELDRFLEDDSDDSILSF